MKLNGRVQGNLPSTLVVTKDYVYVHTDIEQIDENLYEYDEIAYTTEEYNLIVFEQSNTNKADIEDCNEALIELAEIIGG